MCMNWLMFIIELLETLHDLCNVITTRSNAIVGLLSLTSLFLTKTKKRDVEAADCSSRRALV